MYSKIFMNFFLPWQLLIHHWIHQTEKCKQYVKKYPAWYLVDKHWPVYRQSDYCQPLSNMASYLQISKYELSIQKYVLPIKMTELFCTPFGWQKIKTVLYPFHVKIISDSCIDRNKVEWEETYNSIFDLTTLQCAHVLQNYRH